MRIAFIIAFLASAASYAQQVPVSRHIKKIMTNGDGFTPATAFKVSSVKDEYQIVAALNMKVQSQSLVVQKKPFDLLKVTNDAGEVRDLWFEISSFYLEF